MSERRRRLAPWFEVLPPQHATRLRSRCHVEQAHAAVAREAGQQGQPSTLARLMRSVAEMKREFPTLWAKASTLVATPLIIVVALLYMGKIVGKPASEIYGFGLSAVGIAAALAAICLSAGLPVGTTTTLPVLRYAGEKYLHSCLLLIQVLFLAFARDSVLTWEWVARYDSLKRAVEALANTAGVFVAATAAWCWYWAFADLNKELWANWRHRIEEINRARTVSEEAKQNGGAQNGGAQSANGEPV